MDLDKLNWLAEQYSGVEELLKFAKRHCIKCIKDLSDTNLKAGLYYEIIRDESGVWINEGNGKFIDLYDPYLFPKVKEYFEV